MIVFVSSEHMNSLINFLIPIINIKKSLFILFPLKLIPLPIIWSFSITKRLTKCSSIWIHWSNRCILEPFEFLILFIKLSKEFLTFIRYFIWSCLNNRLLIYCFCWLDYYLRLHVELAVLVFHHYYSWNLWDTYLCDWDVTLF